MEVLMVFTAILGLLIGSFLNVCIYRLPQGQSIVSPPSHCMSCGHRLGVLDLIPVASYVLLGGRCRYCGQSFSCRYAAVELLTACLFLWCLHRIGLSAELAKALLFVSFLIVIAFIDLDHQLILDKVLAWFAALGVLIQLGMGIANLGDIMLGALLGSGILLVIAILSQGGMGDGDIKFMAALGLWLGWRFTLLALFLAFLIGGLIGFLLLVFHLKKRKDYIPFGPFIAAGAFLAFLYGYDLIRWYFLGVLGQ